jgi:hypothetical protein
VKSRLSLGDLVQTYGSIFRGIRDLDGEDLHAEKVRVGLETLSAAELDSLATVRARFAHQSSSSDHLRLPRIADVTDQDIGAAVTRIASMTAAPVATTEAGLVREQRMRAALATIGEMIAAIQQKPNRSV